jgi:membrane associated rhomboid family serine protease
VAVFVALEPSAFKGDLSPRSSANANSFLYEYALVPCELSHGERLTPALVQTCAGGKSTTAPAQPLFPHKLVYASVLFSMFFHANFLHLAGNMFFLWIFGDNIEEWMGRWLFAAFYLFGGLVAALGHVATNPNSLAPVVGASGAVAAVMGAYLVQSPRARLTAIVPPFFFLPFRIPAAVFLVEWLVLQFFTSADTGIAWVAHVAGFASGIAVGLVVRSSKGPGPPRHPHYAR